MTVIGHIGPSPAGNGRTDLEPVPGFDAVGVIAFTTTRDRGDFALHSSLPATDVFGRWDELAKELAPHALRLACAEQVHGYAIVEHEAGWNGWLRAPAADAQIAWHGGTAMAVTGADCVPVFVAHPDGATAIAHSGWRGTVAGVANRVVERFVAVGRSAQDLRVHCGPSICGSCYEVSPDVLWRLTGRTVSKPTPVDLRQVIADGLHAMGVGEITISPWCTRCHNHRFFSHRYGDSGRQVSVIVRA